MHVFLSEKNPSIASHSTLETEVAKQNVPQVWSTPSFKALKMLNLFDLR